MTDATPRMLVMTTLLAALVAVAVFALGQNGMAVAVGGLGAVVGLALVGAFPLATLCGIILSLGLMPFFAGLDLGARGIFPKIYLDEVLLLMALGVAAVALVFGRSRPRLDGWAWQVVPLLCLAGLGATFAVNPPDYVALRTFVENYVLGVFLFFLFVQEADEPRLKALTLTLAALALILAAAGLVEFVVKENPLMEIAAEGVSGQKYLYLSPELTARTGSVYRPYLIFFHPSEAGTFVAMCLPFVLLHARAMANRALAACLLLLPLSFIVINFTRGVWLAVGVAAILFLPMLRRWALILGMAGAAGVGLLAVAWSDSAFVHRLLDPSNLFVRFFYWDIGLRIFMGNSLLGIGFMAFKERYLDHVTAVDPVVGSDITRVLVADNVVLTTAVELGLVGLFSLALLWGFLVRGVVKAVRRLREAGRDDLVPVGRAVLAGLCIYLVAGLMVDAHLFSKATKLFFILAGIGFALGRVEPRPKNPEPATGRGA